MICVNLGNCEMETANLNREVREIGQLYPEVFDRDLYHRVIRYPILLLTNSFSIFGSFYISYLSRNIAVFEIIQSMLHRIQKIFSEKLNYSPQTVIISG